MKNTLLCIFFLSFSSAQVFSQQMFQKTFGGSGSDELISIAQTTDSGYVMVGNTTSFGLTISNIYIIKTDKYANVLWTNTFGGSYSDIASCVVATKDGGCVITGGNGDKMLLLKLDANGLEQWEKYYRANRYNNSTSVIQTTDDGYLFGDYTYNYESDAISSTGFLIKTDSTGTVQWSQFIYDEADLYYEDNSLQLTETNDGG
jgi:hypothetical protein